MQHDSERIKMQTNKFAQHLWLNCYAVLEEEQLKLTATIHRRNFIELKNGSLEASDIEAEPCYTFVTYLSHPSDCEKHRADVETYTLMNSAPLLSAIRSEYSASVLRTELLEALDDYYSGGSGELEKHEQHGQTTHYRDLEPLSY
jgi:hypothetical protein